MVAIVILLLSPAVILRTPTDIFPNIDIPVISVAWTYTGLNPEDLETRLTTPFEKGLTAPIDNIEHIESTTYNGTAVVKAIRIDVDLLVCRSSWIICLSAPVRGLRRRKKLFSSVCMRDLQVSILGRVRLVDVLPLRTP